MSDAPRDPFEQPPVSIPPPPPSGAAPPPGYVAYDAYTAGVHGLELATAGSRIVARIIDGLIVGAVFFVCALMFLGGGGSLSVGGVGTSGVWTFQLVVLLVSVVWEAAFLVARGATPGKMAMSIKVVYDDERQLDLQGALLRLSPNITFGLLALSSTLVTVSSLGNLVVSIVSLVFLLTHERRQTVWDRIAKTIVVQS